MRSSMQFICFVIALFGLASCGGGSGGGSDSGGGTPTNTAPTANAGADQTVQVDDTVSLNASGSSDANGDSLSYTWSLDDAPMGSLALLSSTDTVTTEFVADEPGDYTISLIVNDGTVDSTVDEVTVTAIEFMGNVTTGVGTADETNLFPMGVRPSPLGTILDSNAVEWAVPADVNYQDNNFPFASDLFNPYGLMNADETAARNQLDTADIVEIDAGGELITAYVYADNYFEFYVNGVPVGKDPVPFTEFNSSIVQFRVELPFTAAILLVDWEEDLGTGTESNGGSDSPGDGGLVAVFKNESDEIIDITDASWRAQVFYTAPITDLTCLSESGSQRLSTTCSTAAVNDLSAAHGVHWELPADWTTEGFDDSGWPTATTYTNQTVGVNRPAYENFDDVFDDPTDNAQFIWSTNLVLDNEVAVRKVIDD